MFLSYAPEDALAAQRMTEALRTLSCEAVSRSTGENRLRRHLCAARDNVPYLEAVMSKRVLSVALTSIVLAACFPAAEKYQRIEATGARYFHSICQGGYGPPSVVYYPYHGIFISLSISNHIALGLHLPEGMTAQLNEEVVHISGFTESGPVDESFPLRAVPQGALGTINPPEFVGMRDPFSYPLNVGPLAGATEKGRYIWHLFIAETAGEPRRIMSPPNGLLRGTLQLPSMTINGERYEPQTLQFERQTYVGTYPVNC